VEAIDMSELVRKNILVLEPERDIGELFARALESRRDCKCYLASSEGELFDLLNELSFTLILIDIGLAMAGEFSLLKKLRKAVPETVLIVDAYLHQKPFTRQALDLGAQGYVIKPIKVESFRKEIDHFHRTAFPAQAPL
jgi:DNA-binding response OmpR family regulator